MLPLSALRSMRVMFTTPCYAAQTASTYSTSMFRLAYQAALLGLNCDLECHSESSITHARDHKVAEFLSDPSYTHLFWWDADVGARAEQAFRLLLADRDYVAAVYPIKELNWPSVGLPAHMTKKQFEDRFQEYPITVGPGGAMVDAEGFMDVVEVATGFTCVKRAVFEKVIAAHPELAYVPDRVAGHERARGEYWNVYGCLIDENRRYLTEDYAFCKRWRDLGGKITVDTASKLTHLGQLVFHGDFDQSIRARQPLLKAV